MAGPRLFVHSPFILRWTIGLFLPLAVVNSSVMDLGVHQRVKAPVPPPSFGDVPRSGSAGSHGNSVFNFSGNLQTVFHVGRPFYIPIKRSLSCVESGLCGAAGCITLGLPPSERGPQPLCRRGSILESEEDQGPPLEGGAHRPTVCPRTQGKF